MKTEVIETNVGYIVRAEGSSDDVRAWCARERGAGEAKKVVFTDGRDRDAAPICDGAFPPSLGIATYVTVDLQHRADAYDADQA